MLARAEYRSCLLSKALPVPDALRGKIAPKGAVIHGRWKHVFQANNVAKQYTKDDNVCTEEMCDIAPWNWRIVTLGNRMKHIQHHEPVVAETGLLLSVCFRQDQNAEHIYTRTGTWHLCLSTVLYSAPSN